MEKKLEECVNVAVRIKPVLQDETCLQIINENPPVLLLSDKSQTFHFDHIFTETSDQTTIYNETVRPLVSNVKMGYNCTAFAYGQTGTGKSFTMGTNLGVNFEDIERGIIPRTLEDFFVDSGDFEISISFIEIYNEKVFDLLDDNIIKPPLPVKGFTVHGFIKESVFDVMEALAFLKKGNKNRHTGETKQNSTSSRSHSIFTIYCHAMNENQDTVAKLNLVDLAGSESVRKTGTRGTSFHEAININKGLLSLGQVMAALSIKSNHIPYRQSIITTILQDSLNKNNFVLLIACVSANADDSGETLQTLEFASRVKRMKNKPEVNLFLTKYKKDNPGMFINVRGMTPSKRANCVSSFETPFTPFKKNRPFMPIIPEPSTIANSSDSSTKSLFSMSLSSIATEPAQQNLSPVIKKYMNAMENSIIHKLEGVIENTLKKTRRSSRRLAEKENCKTPTLLWDKVATIVRSEILQMTGKSTRMTSSPLENTSPIEPAGLPRTKLTYDDSNCSIKVDDVNLKVDNNNGVLFKVPELKVVKKKKKSLQSPVNRRKSTRLQLKELEIPSTQIKNHRRSVRLQIQESNKENKVVATPLRKTSQTKSKSRCTNCSNPRINKLKQFEQNPLDSPITSRTNHVLHILNEGSLKDIEKLHTIGAKTAEKIELFRRLNGGIKSISDLMEMPNWTKNKYQKFISDNFLRET